jgi:hypothetical protein
MLYRGFLFMPLLRVPLLVSPLLPIYGEHVRWVMVEFGVLEIRHGLIMYYASGVSCSTVLLAWNTCTMLLRSLMTVSTRWMQCSEFQTSAPQPTVMGWHMKLCCSLMSSIVGLRNSSCQYVKSIILGVTSPPELFRSTMSRLHLEVDSES